MSSSRMFRTFLMLFLIAIMPAGAAVAAPPGSAPAATLLLPYFEVDLASPEGLTTLFSVNNAGEEPVVAHVVLWTDWGLPTYSFDLVLAADDVETLNLRDLFATGFVPPTDGSAIAGCAAAVARPPFDVETLRRRHSGRPDTDACAGPCFCHGSGRLGVDRAVGYVTVDVASTCAGEETFFPSDPGYFPVNTGGAPPEGGYVADHNVLWGDFFYVASNEDSAQGGALVQIPYDADTAPGESFYRRYVGVGTDRRVGLGSRYRGRFLDGGPFDGGTDLIAWLESFSTLETKPCGSHELADICQSVGFDLYDEAGTLQSSVALNVTELALRLPVGGEELPVEADFGFFELDNFVLEACLLIPSDVLPRQAWVIPVMKAEGRYSVGLPASRMRLP